MSFDFLPAEISGVYLGKFPQTPLCNPYPLPPTPCIYSLHLVPTPYPYSLHLLPTPTPSSDVGDVGGEAAPGSPPVS